MGVDRTFIVRFTPTEDVKKLAVCCEQYDLQSFLAQRLDDVTSDPFLSLDEELLLQLLEILIYDVNEGELECKGILLVQVHLD